MQLQLLDTCFNLFGTLYGGSAQYGGIVLTWIANNNGSIKVKWQGFRTTLVVPIILINLLGTLYEGSDHVGDQAEYGGIVLTWIANKNGSIKVKWQGFRTTN
jgi:hypothetical protein